MLIIVCTSLLLARSWLIPSVELIWISVWLTELKFSVYEFKKANAEKEEAIHIRCVQLTAVGEAINPSQGNACWPGWSADSNQICWSSAWFVISDKLMA